MIHKFEGIEKDANARDNIYVFIDEAHRSVARELGTYLMAALPNATIIGFTGTPIARTAHGEGTFKIFGADDDLGYLDKYSIAESIKDETTLPIRHLMAPSEITVPAAQLDREFFALAEKEGVTDVEELNRILDRAVGLRTFLTADDRVEEVAAFVAGHFQDNVLPLGYKAFLVGVNREACAKYKRALDQLLPPEWSAAVYSENTNDVVERPLVAQLQLSEEQEKDVRLTFKKADENPKILIVTDKLLTGYDAPLLYCMYLDKPMRDHVLLQAIARVNRPYVDGEGHSKSIGLVVDFVGVLRELRKALQFDSSDVSGAIEDLDLLMGDFFTRIAEARADYLVDAETDRGATPSQISEASAQYVAGDDARLEQVVFGRLLSPDARKAFYAHYKEIEALWEILSPCRGVARPCGHIQTARQALRRRPQRILQSPELRSRVGAQDETAGRTVGCHVRPRQPYQGRDLRRSHPHGATAGSWPGRSQGVQPGARPPSGGRQRAGGWKSVLRPLKERAEDVLKGLEERTTTGLAAMDLLAALAEEKDAAVAAARDSTLPPRAFGVYWALKDDAALRAAGVSAKQFTEEAQALVNRFPNAAVNADEQRRFRTSLYNPLLSVDSHERGRIVDQTLAILLGGDADAGR